MQYRKVIPGRFINRPNRFIAHVEIDGREETVHVKNTGRCRELLLPGSTVYLACADNPARKTKYDLIAVKKQRDGKDPLLVNIDSQAANDAAEEWLRSGVLFSEEAVIRREVNYGASRFDFYVEDGDTRAFLEVKGVTLEKNGIAMFPDAPTERGVKHIRELINCMQMGYKAYILFVLQMKEIRALRPYDAMHRAFGDALRDAAAEGVHVLAVDCRITPDSITPDAPVPVSL